MKYSFLLFWVFLVSVLQGQVSEKDYSSDTEILIDSLINETRDFVSQQRFEDAVVRINEAKNIAIKYDSILYAKCLYNYGRVYLYATRYNESIPYFKKAMGVQERNLGNENMDYAYSITGLGNALRELGKFEQVYTLYEKSKDIRKKLLGENHSSYANAVNNLAILYLDLDEFDKAETLLLESKRIRLETLGDQDPDYAASLYNLGALYIEYGNYRTAESYYRKGIEIEKNTLGESHIYYINSLHSLGELYSYMGKYDLSEEYFLESLNLLETNFSKDNDDYVAFGTNLASLYDLLGRYDEAEIIYKELMQIQKTLIDSNPLTSASLLNNLANLYLKTNRNDLVSELLEESKDIIESNFGKEKEEYAIVLNGLASIYEYNKEYDKTDSVLIESSNIQVKRLSEMSSLLSQSELAEYTEKFSDELSRILKVIHNRKINKIPCDNLLTLAFENTLFYKGYLLFAAKKLNRLVPATEEAKELYSELKSIKRLLARQFSLVLAERDEPLISDMQSEITNLEKKLSGELKEYQNLTRVPKISDLRSNLKESEAVIEFVNFRNVNNQDSTERYAALVLRFDESVPAFIDLGKSTQVDVSLHSKSIDNTYSRGLKPVRVKGIKGVYEFTWKKIESFLLNINSLYYSPVGVLHKLNLKVVSDIDGNMLSNKYNMTRLISTRSIIDNNQAKDLIGNTYYFYGGIDYNKTTTESERKLSSELKKGTGEEDFDALEKWKFLPGTQEEIESIEGIFSKENNDVQLFYGSFATEESLKNISNLSQSPRIIHLATHGFFYETINIKGEKRDELAFKTSKNPLIRSGLILAGANKAWTQSIEVKGEEDGVLTAYELSQIDLNNTELVVLSACETGLGDIVGNEGVFGLQRALKIAGVKNILLSLWQVPDKETSDLMVLFYRNMIENGMSIQDSLREAQNKMKQDGIPPYYWAGFILIE